MQRRPRILEVFNRYREYGGEDLAVDQIHRHLSPEADTEQAQFRSADWMGPGAPPVWQQALYMWRNPEAMERLRELNDSFRPDAWLVHNVFPVASASVFREAGKLGVPLIFMLHNYRPFALSGWCDGPVDLSRRRWNFLHESIRGAWQGSRLKSAWLSLVMESAHALGWFKNVSAWVAISNFMAAELRKAGVPPEKIHVLRHAWEPQHQSAASEDRGYYLFMGRLTEEKGLSTLLAAWQILEEKMGAAAPGLVIAGEGPLKPLVLEAAESSKTIGYAGFVRSHEKHALIRRCRAMVVPSVWGEPLGLVTYEAYEAGKPVLAARSGGLAETVLNGQTGILHPAGDAEELAAHVRVLERMPYAERAAMGRAGRDWLEDRASPERWRAQFASILSSATRCRFSASPETHPVCTPSESSFIPYSG